MIWVTLDNRQTERWLLTGYILLAQPAKLKPEIEGLLSTKTSEWCQIKEYHSSKNTAADRHTMTKAFSLSVPYVSTVELHWSHHNSSTIKLLRKDSNTCTKITVEEMWLGRFLIQNVVMLLLTLNSCSTRQLFQCYSNQLFKSVVSTGAQQYIIVPSKKVNTNSQTHSLRTKHASNMLPMN